MEELKQIDNNIEKFSLKEQTFISKVVEVIDGDTIKVVFKFCGKYYKWTCRLYGINTPETRTRNLEEKKRGLFVKEYVKEKLLNKIINVKCYDFDSFGRLLGDIYTDEQNFNEHLIDIKYACKFEDRKTYIWDFDL